MIDLFISIVWPTISMFIIIGLGIILWLVHGRMEQYKQAHESAEKTIGELRLDLNIEKARNKRHE